MILLVYHLVCCICSELARNRLRERVAGGLAAGAGAELHTKVYDLAAEVSCMDLLIASPLRLHTFVVKNWRARDAGGSVRNQTESSRSGYILGQWSL